MYEVQYAKGDKDHLFFYRQSFAINIGSSKYGLLQCEKLTRDYDYTPKTEPEDEDVIMVCRALDLQGEIDIQTAQTAYLACIKQRNLFFFF